MIKTRAWWIYLLIFIISQLAAVAVMLGVRLAGGQLAATSEWAIVATLFVANALAIALFFLFRPRSITWTSTLSGTRGAVGRRSALILLTAIPITFLVNLLQEAFFPDIPDLVGAEMLKTIMYNPLGLLTVAVLGPIAEELLFRGGVQTDLQLHHSDQGWFVPICVSAVLFSLIHMNPAQMPIAFILGLVLCFAYWWTGSLVAPVLIHVFNNSFACLMSYVAPNDDSLISFLGGKANAGIAAVICIFWLAITLRAVSKEGLSGIEKG